MVNLGFLSQSVKGDLKIICTLEKKKLFEPNNAYLDGMICLSNINKWL